MDLPPVDFAREAERQAEDKTLSAVIQKVLRAACAARLMRIPVKTATHFALKNAPATVESRQPVAGDPVS